MPSYQFVYEDIIVYTEDIDGKGCAQEVRKWFSKSDVAGVIKETVKGNLALTSSTSWRESIPPSIQSTEQGQLISNSSHKPSDSEGEIFSESMEGSKETMLSDISIGNVPVPNVDINDGISFETECSDSAGVENDPNLSDGSLQGGEYSDEYSDSGISLANEDDDSPDWIKTSDGQMVMLNHYPFLQLAASPERQSTLQGDSNISDLVEIEILGQARENASQDESII